MDLQFETDLSFTNDDKSWIRRREGLDDAMTVTLDLALFTLGTHYPNGFIPSGITIAKVTATGLYGPYNNALSNGQENMRGHILNAVDMTTVPANNRSVTALFWRGTVRQTKLPTNHGLDAAGIVDAGPTSAIVDGQAPVIRYE